MKIPVVEIILAIAVIIVFGFVAPCIGNKHFEDTMPQVTGYQKCVDPEDAHCSWSAGCNVPLCEPCQIRWYFWCWWK